MRHKRDAVQLHFSRRGIIQAQEELKQCGLAAPRRADNSTRLPSLSLRRAKVIVGATSISRSVSQSVTRKPATSRKLHRAARTHTLMFIDNSTLNKRKHSLTRAGTFSRHQHTRMHENTHRHAERNVRQRVSVRPRAGVSKAHAIKC